MPPMTPMGFRSIDLSGSDLKEVGDALVLTDNLQLSLTRKQFAQAIDYVWQHAAK